MPNTRFPKIDLQEIRDDFIKFELSETDTSVANAIRRVMIAEVPTLAIDLVSIEVNTSVITDEFLAHRLGMIPLRLEGGLEAFKKRFVYSADCDCDEHCPNCSVEFELDVRAESGTQTVTSDSLRSLDPYIKPVHFSSEEEANNTQDTGVIIAKLGPGQRLKLNAIAKLWSPVAVATYMFEPIITLNQSAISISAIVCLLTLVMDLSQLQVEDNMRCMYCDECVKLASSYRENPEDDMAVTVTATQDKFIFSVETTGQLKPEEVVIWALDIIKDKLAALKHQCLELSQDEGMSTQNVPITPFG
ncbi:hypothetical protein B5M09_000548 [Aphanomyces astaci]|uniref:DNA-directed RNA polymerase RpoA/D/Rpb3-type domain-containing protein n=1 Tax=Aphanomyces astaci TaxID=112090 RepID=A0A3R7Y3I4_APHAT|nr:hypothetical protein B5M09_000548 [Aphanomyces astaci]